MESELSKTIKKVMNEGRSIELEPVRNRNGEITQYQATVNPANNGMISYNHRVSRESEELGKCSLIDHAIEVCNRKVKEAN